MAGITAVTAVEQLQHQRKGAIAISLTDFNAITVSQIAEGSGIEIAGAWVDFLAAESMGSNWASMAAGVVYAMIDSVALTSAYTTTAPTWNEELQGWYDATGQYRYYAKLYKDGSSNYTQKAIYTRSRSIMQLNEGAALNVGANADQILRMADDARMLWDESDNVFDFDKGVRVAAGDLTVSAGNVAVSAGNINFATAKGLNGIKKVVNSIYSSTASENSVFDALAPSIPNVNDEIIVTGGIYATNLFVVSKAVRYSSTVIHLYTAYAGDIYTFAINDGLSTTHPTALAW